ncbi:MAG: bifunctional methylenetetrahydrofolate dehydrogenase/methenyltetrahydrofolate cyclohydrolase [Clostridia bacterium]|nr:bifunctional methylenetetrahydrofolate dehydrogenase/methenyltetrahydrofolate cyclohydrolase [Clostridia bacterium]
MGRIINGTELAANVLADVQTRVNRLKAEGIDLCLAVILVGESRASQIYVQKKQQACGRVGICSLKFELPAQTSQAELLGLIGRLNADASVHGILCQLPLPKHMDEQAVLKAIASEKDVDGFSARINFSENDLAPCTPSGIIRMIEASGAKLEGSNCVIVGRSNIVGKPMALLLLQRHATVTVCHTQTQELGAVTKKADILIVAAGCPHLIGPDMVKDGAVVIDVGINRDESNRLCGDVDFETVKEKAACISPVPGGVGPMTIAMLMRNTLLVAQKQMGLA